MEEKFIRLADLMKFPIREDHYDKEHGNENFIYGIETVFEYIDALPKYEIAVQSEGRVAEDILCKALECCTMENDGKTCPCDTCPRNNGDYSDTDCIKENCVEALDRIRYQSAMIKFLQNTVAENEQRHIKEMVEFNCKQCACALLDKRNEALKEVERLTGICNSYALQYGTVRDKQAVVDEIKAEAIKEFAERLKPKLSYYDEVIVDTLVKEMTEGEK